MSTKKQLNQEIRELAATIQAYESSIAYFQFTIKTLEVKLASLKAELAAK